MTGDEKLEMFARALVQQVRDQAIAATRAIGSSQHAWGKAGRWRAAAITPEQLRVVAPDIVDITIFELLRSIDEGALRLVFQTGDFGEEAGEVSLVDDGKSELGGWYMSQPGWRDLYSREPVPNDDAAPENDDPVGR